MGLERLQTEAVEAQSTISDLHAEAERLCLAGEEELTTERARFKTLEEAKEADSLDASKALDHVQSELEMYRAHMEQKLLQEKTRTNELLQAQSEDGQQKEHLEAERKRLLEEISNLRRALDEKSALLENQREATNALQAKVTERNIKLKRIGDAWQLLKNKKVCDRCQQTVCFLEGPTQEPMHA